MQTYRATAMAIASLGVIVAAGPAAAGTKCTMKFSLAGWSVFYKSATGSGTITCDNGQSAQVSIKATGGGLTVGKSKISNGKGDFSEVSDISELFGAYAQAEAHAGAVESSSAQALTKGTVSLALSGTGKGFDVGVDFGKFTIEKSGAKKKNK
jgi:hypothetical protein